MSEHKLLYLLYFPDLVMFGAVLAVARRGVRACDHGRSAAWKVDLGSNTEITWIGKTFSSCKTVGKRVQHFIRFLDQWLEPVVWHKEHRKKRRRHRWRVNISFSMIFFYLSREIRSSRSFFSLKPSKISARQTGCADLLDTAGCHPDFFIFTNDKQNHPSFHFFLSFF